VLSTSNSLATAQNGIAESLPNLSDEILDPKFHIAVHRSPLGSGDEGSFKDLEQLPMRDAQGKDHVCYLPPKASLPDEQEQAVEDVRILTRLRGELAQSEANQTSSSDNPS